MAAVPVTRTFVSGEVVLASHFNTNINGPLGFLLAPPIFQGRQTVAQTLTTGVFAAITMDAEDVDSAGGHSTSSNTSRYIAQYAGWYILGGVAGIAANATGRRLTKWRVNGSADVNGSGVFSPSTAASVVKVPLATIKVFLNVGDYVEAMVAQESGGNVNTAVSATDQSYAGADWRSN